MSIQQAQSGGPAASLTGAAAPPWSSLSLSQLEAVEGATEQIGQQSAAIGSGAKGASSASNYVRIDTLEITQGDGQCCVGAQAMAAGGKQRPQRQRGNEEETEGDAHENHTISPSILSSVMTAEELSDPRGFAIVCWVIFLADMCRGVVFPTLWPLIESLGGDEVDLGYAVAAFSFGRALISPVFGKWSFTYGYTNTLLASAAVLSVGSTLYAQAPRIGGTGFVVLAQMLLGVGSGTLAVSRAYTAEVTAQRVRTTYLAWLSAVQYLGFACTPLVGSLLSNFFQGDQERVVEKGFFLLNAYTAPGYFILFFCLVTVALILLFFPDRRRSSAAKSKKSKKRAAMEQVAASTTFLGIPTHTACILGCMMLNVVTKGSISAFETLGTNIAIENFGLTASDAGYIVAVCGFLGVIELLCMGYITKYLTDIQMIIGGLVATIAGMSSLVGLDEDGVRDDVNPTWRYIFAIFMVYTVGFSIAQAAVLGLFSKIVGRIPQGTLMGWFSVAGAGSRVVYPIMSGYVVHYKDVGTLFIILIATLGLSICYVITNRGTLSHLSY